MKEKILVMGILLGPTILGVAILVLAGFAAKSLETLAGWGLLAGVLFVLQFMMFGKLASWGGNHGPNSVVGSIFLGSLISLVVYWVLGTDRLKRKNRE